MISVENSRCFLNQSDKGKYTYSKTRINLKKKVQNITGKKEMKFCSLV